MVNVFHYLINLERFGVYLYVELIGNLAHSELRGNQRTRNVQNIALTMLLGVNFLKKTIITLSMPGCQQITNQMFHKLLDMVILATCI